MNYPTFSLWGEVQHCEELYHGIYLVTTASHGGIMVERGAELCLSSAARKCSERDGGYLCFEEDCCEQVVLRELLDRGLWKLPERIKDPKAFEEGINQVIQQYHPSYWKAREAGKTVGKHRVQKEGQPLR